MSRSRIPANPARPRRPLSAVIALVVAVPVLAVSAAPAAMAEDVSLVSDIRPGSQGSTPGTKLAVGQHLYFAADDGIVGDELWRTDGTRLGTELVKDLRPGNLGSGISSLTEFAGLVYFVAGDGVSGRELWMSDGTEAGTVQVADLRSGRTGSIPEQLTVVGDDLYFTADDGISGRELWRVRAGGVPTMVKDVRFGSETSSPGIIGALGDRVVFGADDGTLGREPWVTDGTAAGTSLLLDVVSDGPGSDPLPGALLGGRLIFPATSAAGVELWSTDGTPSGTRMVKDVVVGGDLNPRELVVAGSRLFFTGTTPSTGREVFVTDGTAQGTQVASETRGGSDSGQPTGLVAVGSAVLFSADNGNQGRELWRSDGTVAGSGMVQDINSLPGSMGPGAGDPRNLTRAGDGVYFSADDGRLGRELWKYSPATGRASLVHDLAEGVDSAEPADFGVLGEALVMSATLNSVGRELFSIAIEAPEATPTTVAIDGPESVEHGEGARLTVRVASASGFPGGTVRLLESGALIDQSALSNGVAELSVPVESSVGVHDFRVEYSGDTDYAPSSGTHRLEVAAATSSVRLSASRTKVRKGQKVNFRMDVTVSNSDAPEGRLVLKEEGRKRASLRMGGGDAGHIEKKLKLKKVGVREFTVTYKGGPTVGSSVSQRVVIRVVKR